MMVNSYPARYNTTAYEFVCEKYKVRAQAAFHLYQIIENYFTTVKGIKFDNA